MTLRKKYRKEFRLNSRPCSALLWVRIGRESGSRVSILVQVQHTLSHTHTLAKSTHTRIHICFLIQMMNNVRSAAHYDLITRTETAKSALNLKPLHSVLTLLDVNRSMKMLAILQVAIDQRACNKQKELYLTTL